jgi:uncharacterized membrane protein YccC
MIVGSNGPIPVCVPQYAKFPKWVGPRIHRTLQSIIVTVLAMAIGSVFIRTTAPVPLQLLATFMKMTKSLQ